MESEKDYLRRAVDCLQCPKCGGRFNILGESEVRCAACGFAVAIERGNIFCFEQSELPENVMEKTLYGPEGEELLQELAGEGSARLNFLKYLSHQSVNLCVLDYGCGSSRQVFDLAHRFKNGIVFGLDYDLVPLQIISDAANKLGFQNIFLIQFRSAKLPFRDNIFGIVTSHQVLEHVSHPDESVNEICRIMKQGGIFEVDFPNGNSAGEFFRRFFHKLNRTKNPHISRISLKRAKKMFDEAVFKMEKFQSVQTITGPLSYFIEGLFLRYIMKKYKIWSFRKKYQNNFVFRGLQRLELFWGRHFPRMGHAFEFILIKK